MSNLSLEFLKPETVREADFRAIRALTSVLRDGRSADDVTFERVIFAARNSTIVVVRRKSTLIVGMATLTGYATVSGYCCWIEDVVLAKPYRGHGYGRKMIDILLSRAAESSAEEVWLTSNSRRKIAQTMYKSLGFEEYPTVVFRRPL
ncbi:GNAT family N-acetyltransferase [Acetobacteraceae bacterium]|nr:GNAT family N-acetyltransferase [Candidatus Parcubacteria bacterium]